MKVDKQPSHRPSRRDQIIAAAMKLFADKGYAGAAVSDIADQAEVAVTAVYYHFNGKDDLFAAAMRAALRSLSTVAIAARTTAADQGADGLRREIDAVWDWVDEQPHAAALVQAQLSGATPQLASIRQEFLELQESRATDHLPSPGSDKLLASAEVAAGLLRMRTLLSALMSVNAMRLADGPLEHVPRSALRTEMHQLSARLLH